MCKEISSILTKDYVFFGDTDSHEDIISQHKLHADGVKGPNIVRIEVTPSNRDYTKPLKKWKYKVDQDTLKKWKYKVDQDTLPEWYDAELCEKRIRSAMEVSGIAALYADYKAKKATILADYEAKRAPLDAGYEANVALLYAGYEANVALLYADYEAKRAPLYADYCAKIAPIYADYRAKRIKISKKKW